MTKLSTLDLNDNGVENVDPLTKQTELSILMLERNKISDVTPLVGWARADATGQKRFAPYLRLFLTGNPLSEESKAKAMPALKEQGVRLHF